MSLQTDAPRKFRAGCDGKVRFDSPKIARQVARRRGRGGKHGEAYRCRHCGGWHIGRTEQMERF